jgi:hypothetical protein
VVFRIYYKFSAPATHKNKAPLLLRGADHEENTSPPLLRDVIVHALTVKLLHELKWILTPRVRHIAYKSLG